jgi:hypothetical protein
MVIFKKKQMYVFMQKHVFRVKIANYLGKKLVIITLAPGVNVNFFRKKIELKYCNFKLRRFF